MKRYKDLGLQRVRREEIYTNRGDFLFPAGEIVETYFCLDGGGTKSLSFTLKKKLRNEYFNLDLPLALPLEMKV